MKYAFIILIALYLLVYGCGPDNSKKAEEKTGHTVQSTEPKPVKAPQTPATDKKLVNTPAEAPQSAKQVGTPATTIPEDKKQPAAEAEKQTAGAAVLELQQPPCKMMTEQKGAIELTQPDEDNIVIMPCGCMFYKRMAQEKAPCLQGHVPPCLMMSGEQPASEEDSMTMPCGHVFMRQPMPDESAIGALQQKRTPCPMEAQPEIVEDSEQNLTAAIEKMVETTNDMVLVTKELVIATQEMLKATKAATNETANIQAVQTPLSSKPAFVAGTKKPAMGEQELVNAMKEAVIATQKAIDAMNQATSKALEPKQN